MKVKSAKCGSIKKEGKKRKKERNKTDTDTIARQYSRQ